MKPKTPRILVVNDDGVDGPGLRPLIAALRSLGTVTALVPEKQRSASSHGLTLHKPLRLRPAVDGIFRLNGGPADCARLGALHLLRGRVDLIASGINDGYNLGQDVVYSGTVGAAMEGTLLDIPSFAVSRGRARSPDFAAAAAVALRVARELLRRGLPRGVCLNVNVPGIRSRSVREPRVAVLGERIYEKAVGLRRDPAGGRYFWLMGDSVRGVPEPGTDVLAVASGHVAVTPLLTDWTCRPLLSRLRSWRF